MAVVQNNSGNTTFVIELTPAGRGAVAVVLVDGSDALPAVQRYFIANGGRLLSNVPLQRIVVGKWGSAAGEELVVTRRSDRRIEVHCHGGLAAVRKILADLVVAGCQEIPWREWLRRSQVSPKLGRSRTDADPIARSAQVALADAITTRTAAILLDQFNGALSDAIQAIIQAIALCDWVKAGELTDALLSRRELGLHLTSPWQVVLAGPPNVGKSSLINALAGFQRAIVSPTPGTTRDVVTLTTAIDGWPVELTDTAGLRNTCDELESAGVRLAEELLRTADLLLVVHDASQVHTTLPANEFAAAWNLLAGRQRVINVWNKIDLRASPMPFASYPAEIANAGTLVNVQTSAMTGAGIGELSAAISNALVPKPPSIGTAIPFLALQVESLVVAFNAIKRRHAAPAQEALQSLLANL